MAEEKKYISRIVLPAKSEEAEAESFEVKDAEARAQLENTIDAVETVSGSGLTATLTKEDSVNTVTIGWDNTITIIFDGGRA